MTLRSSYPSAIPAPGWKAPYSPWPGPLSRRTSGELTVSGPLTSSSPGRRKSHASRPRVPVSSKP